MSAEDYTFYQQVVFPVNQYYHLLGSSIEPGVQELCHYTFMSSFINILKESHIEFWASRFDSQNDPLEFSYAEEYTFTRLGIRQDNVVNCYPYMISFSKERDDLNMWRLYGSEICLVVNISKALKPYIEIEEKATCLQDILAGSVKYYKEKDDCDLTAQYEELKLNLLRLDASYADDKCETLSQYAMGLLKPDSFKIENEYRIIIPDYSYFSIQSSQENNELMVAEKEKPVGIEFRTRNGDILQYKPMKFPKDALCGVIINECDTNRFKLKKQHVLNLLRSRGYDLPEASVVQTNHHFIDIHY